MLFPKELLKMLNCCLRKSIITITAHCIQSQPPKVYVLTLNISLVNVLTKLYCINLWLSFVTQKRYNCNIKEN